MMAKLAYLALSLIALMGVLALFWFGAAILLAPMVQLDTALVITGLAVFCVVLLGLLWQRGGSQ
jgi:hypothetical protein